MTVTESPRARSAAPAATPGGSTIHDWDPEDVEFWERTGRPTARRNLGWSILAEHIGFSVWFIWSMATGFMVMNADGSANALGFSYTAQDVFILTAISSGFGALIRVPYTFAVPIFGGRNWTVVSALMLLLPTTGFAVALQNPGTPYGLLIGLSVLAGFGGGNFASSMANINAFYPQREKGWALGLNAAGGNIGVAVVQLGLPIVVGAGGLFGLVKGAETIRLENVGYVYIALSLLAATGAYFFMNNLAGAKSSVTDTAVILKNRHTWVMSFLYVGTFGSFIGYSGAFGLLIKLYFSGTFDGVFSGYQFAYYAFLGATVGSVARPFGGKLADKLGGARVTLAVFVMQTVGTLGILFSLYQLEQVTSAGVVAANGDYFPLFLATFLFVFAMTGFGNGSTYKMIPAIFRTDAAENGETDLKAVTVKASAAIGIISAVGAFGGFVIPMMFAAPWVDPTEKLGAVINAFWVFTAYYVACALVTWWFYLRKGTAMAAANV